MHPKDVKESLAVSLDVIASMNAFAGDPHSEVAWELADLLEFPTKLVKQISMLTMVVCQNRAWLSVRLVTWESVAAGYPRIKIHK